MKLMLESKLTFPQIIMLLFLFAGSMNVGNFYFYFIVLVFVVCIIANCKNVKIDKTLLILVLFSICYLIFYPKSRDGITTILKQFVFPMCYIVGLNFVNSDTFSATQKEHQEYQMSAVFIILSMGAFVHYLLNMAINFDSINRNTVDIWTNNVLTATGQACLAAMAVGVFAALLFSASKKTVNILALIGMILVFIYNLVLAGRTLIILIALLLIVAFFYTVKSSFAQQKRKVIFATLVVVFIALFLYVQNVFEVRDLILGSNLSNRFDTMYYADDSRIQSKYEYLLKLYDYPLGGGRLRRAMGGYAHELYLDVYSDVGVIGYLLVIFFVISSVVKTWKTVKKENYSMSFKLMVLCVYISLLVMFHLEPIIQGVPWMFCAFCFMSGLFSGVQTPELKKVKIPRGGVE